MAFGRSNSLSINTGSGSSPFGNNPAASGQAPSNPFGASTAAQPPQQQTPNFFGAANPSQAPQSGGLFGNTAAPKPTGLFGNTQPTGSAPQPPQSGGLFGNNNNTNTASTGGGMFGASTQNQQQPTGGLFGASTQNQQQPTGGLFGASTQNQTQQQQQQQQQSTGMFGQSLHHGTNTGLFGAKPSPFGNSTNPQLGNTNNQSQSGLFGSSLANPLSSATKTLAGTLTMGQGSSSQDTVPGTKIDLSNLRPTTRFSDLHDDLKKQIEQVDSFIRTQESLCSQCEAMMPIHASNVKSIKPDVDLITGKIETVELALENDSAAIENAKSLVQRDAGDLMRVARLSENLSLPQQYHYGRNRASATGDEDYDLDLVNYFNKQADAMQKTLDTYTTHLAEIETHLRVVEASTVQQAQQLTAQRTGGRAGSSADTVRELAETLRGFESGILGAAGLVGTCREGVNELILGKLGNEPRDTLRHKKSVRF